MANTIIRRPINLAGPQGYQGNQGTQGFQGSQGTQGFQGNQGTQGFQGDRGYQGFQGDQGTQGFQGNQGTQGFQGPQGDTGLTGLTGLTGFQGPQGTQGFQGVQGPPDGPQGNQGPQGPIGPESNAGNTFELSANVTVGDVTISLVNIPDTLKIGCWMVIDPYTTECEIKKVRGIAGNNITVSAMKFAHSSGDKGFQVDTPIANVLWYGAKSDGSDSIIPFQRAQDDASPAEGDGFYHVYIPPGEWRTSATWFLDTEIHVTGAGPNQTVIKALPSFDFSDPNSAMITGRRDGVESSLWGGPTVRMYLQDLLIDCNNVANSRAVFGTFQQPAYWKNIRINNCLDFGIGLAGQQLVMDNIELIDCRIGVYCNGAGFIWVHGLNIERVNNQVDHHMIIENGLNIHVVGLHMEGTADISDVYMTGNSHMIMLDNVEASNSAVSILCDDESIYSLRNYYTTNASAVIIRDTFKDFEILATDYKKIVPYFLIGGGDAPPATPWTFTIHGSQDRYIRMGAHNDVVGLLQINSSGGNGIDVSVDGENAKAVNLTAETGGFGIHSVGTGANAFGGQFFAESGARGLQVTSDATSTGLLIDGSYGYLPTQVTSDYTIPVGVSVVEVTDIPDGGIDITIPDSSFHIQRVIIDRYGCSEAKPINIYTINNRLINGVNATLTPYKMTIPLGQVSFVNNGTQYYSSAKFPNLSIPSAAISGVPASKVLGAGFQYTLVSGSNISFTPTSGNQNSPDEFNATEKSRIFLHLEHMSTLRMEMNVVTGGATAWFWVQYSTDNGSTWSYIDDGTSSIRVNAAGFFKGTFSTIDPAAREAEGVLLRVVAWDCSGITFEINSLNIYVK